MRDVVSGGWLLSVDFGTSNTAAAHTSESTGAVHTLALSRHGHSMPSSAYAVSASQIDVGDVALNRAADDPSGFILAPKRLLTLGEQTFQLGRQAVPGHSVVAAVLRSVLIRAQQQHSGRPPAGLVLTHPQEWSPRQVRVLTEAAAEIGYGPNIVRTVAEPVAAAHYYARTESVPIGNRIAVFDFGGGTLDVAVLAATSDGSFTVVGARGDNALGGRNFDRAIRGWVYDQLNERNPELLWLLDRAPMLDLRALDESIRTAKELLSETPSAGIDVRVDGIHERLLLTRVEFEDIIAPEVGRAVDLTRAALTDPVQVIYLTGGSSRIPLVHQRLRSLAPLAELDDPKTVVAQGALSAVRADPGYPTPYPAAPPPIPQHRPGPPPGPVVMDAIPVQPKGVRRGPVAAVAVVGALALAGVITVLAVKGSSIGGHGLPTTVPSVPGAAVPGGEASGASPAAETTSSVAVPTGTDMLTPAGVRSLIATLRPHMSGNAVRELDVFSDHASAEAPTPADPKLWDNITLIRGTLTHTPGGTMDSDSGTVDLSIFDWNTLPALLTRAQQTLNVPHPTLRYIIVSPDMFDKTPAIRVYLADAYGGGYLEADNHGVVRKTYPRSS